MSTNQIIFLIIVVLTGIILVIVTYLILVHFMSKKKNRKVELIFAPERLIEEESLMNVMDEKKNVDFNNAPKVENKKFLTDTEDKVEIVQTDTVKPVQINPFGVDLTLREKDNTPISMPSENKNKFLN